MKTRMAPNDRKSSIFTAAMNIAKTKGYEYVSQVNVTREAHCAHGLIHHYFKNMSELRKEIVLKSIDKLAEDEDSIQHLKIVGRALIVGDIPRDTVPSKIAQKAINTLI